MVDPNPIDYLQGRTDRCLRSGCQRRLQTKADVICYLCRHAELNPDYKDEFKVAKNAPSDKWYFLWTYPPFLWEAAEETMGCKSCEAKTPACEFGEYEDGVFKAYISQCPLTKTCKAAVAYWGKDTTEPLAALELFKAQRAASDIKQSIGSEPLFMDQDEIDGLLHDEDFIDLRKPRRSKPISIKVKNLATKYGRPDEYQLYCIDVGSTSTEARL